MAQLMNNLNETFSGHKNGLKRKANEKENENENRLLETNEVLTKKKKNIKRTNNTNSPKNLWTKEEDMLLKHLVEESGESKWSDIALNMHGRVGKQCRDRWRNHLDPRIKKTSWTKEEDLALFKLQNIYGHSWSDISRRIPGRTDLSVKNRWYSFKRKELRQKERSKQQEKFDKIVAANLSVDTSAALILKHKMLQAKKSPSPANFIEPTSPNSTCSTINTDCDADNLSLSSQNPYKKVEGALELVIKQSKEIEALKQENNSLREKTINLEKLLSIAVSSQNNRSNSIQRALNLSFNNNNAVPVANEGLSRTGSLENRLNKLLQQSAVGVQQQNVTSKLNKSCTVMNNESCEIEMVNKIMNPQAPLINSQKQNIVDEGEKRSDVDLLLSLTRHASNDLPTVKINSLSFSPTNEFSKSASSVFSNV